MFGGGGTNISQIAKDYFKSGNSKAKSTNFFIDGARLYSFGEHFALAARIELGNGLTIYALNSKNFSATTRGHQSTTYRAALTQAKIIIRLSESFSKSTSDDIIYKMILQQLRDNKSALELQTIELQQVPFYQYAIENYFDKIRELNELVDYLQLDKKIYSFEVSLAVKKNIHNVQDNFIEAEQAVNKRKQLKLFEVG